MKRKTPRHHAQGLGARFKFRSTQLAPLIPVGSGTVVLSAVLASPVEARQRPNIIFILCDDMGYGDLGCYGQKLIDTPNLDRMAAEGMRFTQAYAGSPVSAPSRASLMTGQHTGHTHVRGNHEYWQRSLTPHAFGDNADYTVIGQEPYLCTHPIMPEVMKEAGYSTGMFGKWAGGYYNLAYPDTYLRTQYSSDLIHRYALDWLDRQTADRPFFGIFTYTLPHAELWQPKDSLLRKYTERFLSDDSPFGGNFGSWYYSNEARHAQFAAMISRLDAQVGEIFDKLKEKGLDENTLVIFTSDNGPHEEGGADPQWFGRDGALRGLKRSTYEGGIRIPFIAKGPGVPSGTVNSHVLAFYDVMPTLMDYAGIKGHSHRLGSRQEQEVYDGISFYRSLTGKRRQRQHEFLYWEFHETDMMALRMSNWKLVVKCGEPHLYDLATDIHEDRDIASSHPSIVQKMVEVIRCEHTDSPLFPITLPLMTETTPSKEQ